VRILVRIFAGLLGLGVAAVGALLAIEVGWAWAKPGTGPLLVTWPRWRSYLDGVAWNSLHVRIVAGVLIALGLLLLIIAAAARGRDVSLQDPAADVSAVTSPASLARVVGQRIRAEDNVSRATVTATAKRIRIRASSRLESEEQLMPRLLRVAKETVDDLPLVETPRISVVVDSPRDRR
jgi:uncharacterized protein DUF6286